MSRENVDLVLLELDINKARIIIRCCQLILTYYLWGVYRVEIRLSQFHLFFLFLPLKSFGIQCRLPLLENFVDVLEVSWNI